MPRVHVEEDALNEFKNALMTSGEEYERELARLTNLIDEITSGDIQGDAAEDLKAKFDAKKDDFNKITKVLEETKELLGMRTTDFTTMMEDIKKEMI